MLLIFPVRYRNGQIHANVHKKLPANGSWKTTVPNSFPKNKKIPIQNIPMRSPKRIVYSIEREIRCSLPRDCSSEMVGSSMADREKVTAFGNIRKDRDMPVRMP